MICRYGKFRSNASLFRWQVFSSTWGPIYSPVMSSISMRSLIFPRNTDVLLWFSFAGGLSPTTRSRKPSPPFPNHPDSSNLTQPWCTCATPQMAVLQQHWQAWMKFCWSVELLKTTKIHQNHGHLKSTKTPFFPGWVLGILRLWCSRQGTASRQRLQCQIRSWGTYGFYGAYGVFRAWSCTKWLDQSPSGRQVGVLRSPKWNLPKCASVRCFSVVNTSPSQQKW